MTASSLPWSIAARVGCCVVGMLVVWMTVGKAVHGQVDYEQPPIDYLHAAVHDRVAQLQERLDRGGVQLGELPCGERARVPVGEDGCFEVLERSDTAPPLLVGRPAELEDFEELVDL